MPSKFTFRKLPIKHLGVFYTWHSSILLCFDPQTFYVTPNQPSLLRIVQIFSHLFDGQKAHFPRGQSGRNVNLTTNFHLMPRVRIRRAITPFRRTPPCCAQVQLPLDLRLRRDLLLDLRQSVTFFSLAR